ncbi:MAG: M48 family metalloprotease [Planctomycetaceae bacterium]|nr:M48 family metalloprotease [Planctomycetaceae bacterium]
MTNEEFERLAQRIEERYRNRGSALGMVVWLWMALGYAVFVGLFLLVLVSGCAAFAAGMWLPGELSWLLLILGAILLAWAWNLLVGLATATSDEEAGIRLERETSPVLFETLDELQAMIGSPPFHEVRLVRTWNAWVRQVPRLGIFGFSRHHLSIGANLIGVLNPKEMRAILAHEIAHYSRRHTFFCRHAYQVFRLWQDLFEGLAKGIKNSEFPTIQRGVGRTFGLFLEWYYPRFTARSVALSRVHERNADRWSVEATSPESVVGALWKIECFGRAIESKLWADIWRRATTEPTPPQDVLLMIRDSLENPGSVEDQRRWMEATSRQMTDVRDSHPSFGDRVREVGFDPEWFLTTEFPRPAVDSALESMIGTESEQYLRKLSREWTEDVSARWGLMHQKADRHVQSDESKQESSEQPELGSLLGKAAPLPPLQDAWDEIVRNYEQGGFEKIAQDLRQFVERSPDHGRANLLLGRELLNIGEMEGIPYLARVIGGFELGLVDPAGESLIEYYRRQGDSDAIYQVRLELDRVKKMHEEARRAEFEISASDAFVSHMLELGDLRDLVALLSGEEDLANAFLVRKEIPHFPAKRVFVLVVEGTRQLLKGKADKEAALVKRLTTKVKLPGRVLIVAQTGPFGKLAKKVMKVSEAKIVSR